MPHVSAADGTRIYYEDDGAGIPILCLSGLTRNSRDFDFVAPHLEGARLIRMDYRGRGQSGWADYRTYDLATEAADAITVMDHLGIDKFAVLGTSRGGLIGMLMAASHKVRLLGVAMNDVGPVVEFDGLLAIKDYLGKAPPFATLEDAASARMADTRQFANIPKERWITFLGHNFTETGNGLQINYDPKLYDAVKPGFDQPPQDAWPLYDLLAGLPLAVIHGVNSDLLSHETAEEMARRFPGTQIAHVPDRGHIPFLDEPEALDALLAWKGKLG